MTVFERWMLRVLTRALIKAQDPKPITPGTYARMRTTGVRVSGNRARYTREQREQGIV